MLIVDIQAQNLCDESATKLAFRKAIWIDSRLQRLSRDGQQFREVRPSSPPSMELD